VAAAVQITMPRPRLTSEVGGAWRTDSSRADEAVRPATHQPRLVAGRTLSMLADTVTRLGQPPASRVGRAEV
jgi:hypothetical protein